MIKPKQKGALPRDWRWHAQQLSALVLSIVTLLTLSTKAEAARECEDFQHVPSVGACARLPTAELFYYDSGPIRKGKGEAVIFLHAASGNADAFKYNLLAFHEAGYRAIAYDRKNVGRSSNTLRDDALGRSRGVTVQDLEDLANYLGLDKFHLVGVAAGAQVALQYVPRNPGRVLSMVLAATLGPPGLATNEPTLGALQSNISLPFEIFCPMTIANPPPPPLRLVSTTTQTTVNVPEVLPEHRELGTWFRATNRLGVEEFHQIAANAGHRTFDGCRFTNIGANQPAVAATDPLNPNTFAKIASHITVRTLLLAGTGDVFFSPPVHMRLWGSYIQDAQYTQLDTGHAPQLENPEDFNAAVLRFLSGGYPFERLTKKQP
ncbi:MAG TPA: alpha/beta hydrolase [Burkholderiaceae bacterium]|nr:alpha/beta hydrolase [Burkholderiaceae bacterium]